MDFGGSKRSDEKRRGDNSWDRQWNLSVWGTFKEDDSGTSAYTFKWLFEVMFYSGIGSARHI